MPGLSAAAGVARSTESRPLCLECNQFLARVQAYDLLQRLKDVHPAQLIARGPGVERFLDRQLPPGRGGSGTSARAVLTGYSVAWPLLALGILIVPPTFYGTSVEQIEEGKVLRVVEALQAILEKNNGRDRGRLFDQRDARRGA